MKRVDTDVVIIGAGFAGYAAASAIRRKGLHTTILEHASVLGGNAVQSNVGTICGNYLRTNSNSVKQLDHPMINHIIEVLDLKPLVLKNGLIVNPYKIGELKHLLNQELGDSKYIDLKLNARIEQAFHSNELIEALKVNCRGDNLLIYAKAFVDCSGNGAIAQLVKAPMIKSESYQNASQVFQVDNIETTNEFSLNMAISRAVLGKIRSGTLSEVYQSCSLVPGSYSQNSALIKFSIPYEITDLVDSKDIKKIGASCTQSIYSILKSEVESMRDAVLNTDLPIPGVRVLQRTEGIEILKKHHVINAIKQKNSAARGTWPMEIWEPSGCVRMEYFDANEYYDIPDSCIRAKNHTNLFLAGKNISATNEAISSSRVMGTCLQTGFSAGCLAVEI